MARKSWAWAGLPLLLLVAILIAAPIWLPERRAETFLVTMLLMMAELIVIGLLVNGRAAGAFIDNRNRLSLSKMQAAGWTVVVLAGFTVAAAFNIAATMYQSGSVGALSIVIPGELLLAMGISATSLVATPVLLTLKSQENAPDDDIMAIKSSMNTSADPNGKVFIRDEPKSATWADLVTGEEVGNANSPDLGKIQAAFITVLLLGTYIAYLFADLNGSKDIVEGLPLLDQSFVWLMAISHGSYLAYKAAPHTSTATTS